MSGLRWIGVAHIAENLVTAFCLIIVARLIEPGAFGLFAMAAGVYGLLLIGAELGLDAAVIKHPSPEHGELSAAYSLSLLAALLMMLLGILLAPQVARFYDEPGVTVLLQVLCLFLPVEIARRIPMAIVERSLEFKRIALIELISSLSGSVLAVVVALQGAGYWALLIKLAFTTSLLTVLILLFGKWRPGLKWNIDVFAGMGQFSARVMYSRAATHISRQADQVLVGRGLGSETLGVYNLATQMMLFPLLLFSRFIARVLFPAAARVEENRARLANGFSDAFAGLFMVVVPMMFGLAVIAPLLVDVLLGEAWRALIHPVQVLAPVGVFTAMALLAESVLLAAGRADLVLRWVLLRGAAVVGAVLLGMPWGLPGIVYLYAAMGVLVELSLLHKLCTLLGLSPSILGKSVLKPALAAAAMSLIVGVLPQLSAEPAIQLTLSVALGVSVYSGLILLWERRRVESLARELILNRL